MREAAWQYQDLFCALSCICCFCFAFDCRRFLVYRQNPRARKRARANPHTHKHTHTTQRGRCAAGAGGGGGLANPRISVLEQQEDDVSAQESQFARVQVPTVENIRMSGACQGLVFRRIKKTSLLHTRVVKPPERNTCTRKPQAAIFVCLKSADPEHFKSGFLLEGTTCCNSPTRSGDSNPGGRAGGVRNSEAGGHASRLGSNSISLPSGRRVCACLLG